MSNALIDNLNIDQGTNFSKSYLIQICVDQTKPWNASTNPYIPLNLTGGAVNMMVRADYNSPTPVLTLSTTNGKIAIASDATTGVFTFTLTPADTTGVSSGIFTDDEDGSSFTGVFDIETTDVYGNVLRPVEGSFTLNREVTR